MDMRCRHGHMRGKGVLVNGTVYKIDADGVAKDVAPQDAAKLRLCGNGWEEDKTGGAKAVPKVKPGKISKVPDIAPPIVNPPLLDKPKLFGGRLPEDEPVPETKTETETDPETTETTETEEEIEAPSMRMTKAELHALADQYEVKYEPETTKRELLELLESAMFEEVSE